MWHCIRAGTACHPQAQSMPRLAPHLTGQQYHSKETKQRYMGLMVAFEGKVCSCNSCVGACCAEILRELSCCRVRCRIPYPLRISCEILNVACASTLHVITVYSRRQRITWPRLQLDYSLRQRINWHKHVAGFRCLGEIRQNGVRL